MLLVCLFPELTTGIRLGISVFPGENYFFCSQSSLVACQVLLRYNSRSEELLSSKHYNFLMKLLKLILFLFA